MKKFKPIQVFPNSRAKTMRYKNVFHNSFSRLSKGAAYVALGLGAILSSNASAADLTIHLAGAASVTRKSVEYRCDATGASIGLPAGPFTAEYINAGGNRLVVVPIAGNMLIFSNVLAGSGARYVAQTFTWWEAGGSVTLYSDSLAGKSQSICKPVAAK
jgi:membrane-bound inhibitor of C-type lysozyme